MAYLFVGGFALIFVAALLLGLWLKKHPGHPVLQALDDMAKQEAADVLWAKIVKVAATKGPTLPPAPTPTTPATLSTTTTTDPLK